MVITNHSGENVPIRYLGASLVELTDISGQLLRSVLWGTLMDKASQVRFVSVSRNGADRRRFNVPFIARVGTVHVVRAGQEQRRVPAPNKLTASLQASRRERQAIYVRVLTPMPINNRARRPSVGRVTPLNVDNQRHVNRYACVVLAIPLQRVFRVVFRQVGSQGPIKVGVPLRVTVPGDRPFNLHVRASTV